MKPNADPSDPLREMLTDNAAHLPALAAQAAREYRARQARQQRRLARAAVLAILAVCGWQTLHWIRPGPKAHDLARTVIQQPAGARPENFAVARTVEEAASKSLPPPPGVTEEQRDLLESARGFPLLLVMDASGKPARIVVLER